MQEIANRFKEEYTELLSRYKEHLSNAQIMSILQSVTRKQIGIKDNPERFQGYYYAKGFPIVDELNHLQTAQDFKNEWKSEEEVRAKIGPVVTGRFSSKVPNIQQVPQHITDAQDYAFKHHCSAQEIAEADCDGDIRHCKDACRKRKPMIALGD